MQHHSHIVQQDIPCFIPFHDPLDHKEIPEKFTFPFYYDPHPWSALAAAELQKYLETQQDWEHNFGIEAGKTGLVIGKMFGVLVVQHESGTIGYLAGFSGKLAGKNHHAMFVPPIFDMLTEDSFFRIEEEALNVLNRRIEMLEEDPAFIALELFFDQEKELSKQRIFDQKQDVKGSKKDRGKRREKAREELPMDQFEKLKLELVDESLKSQYYLKDLIRYWEQRLIETQQKIDVYKQDIDKIKQERKERSGVLQKKLFDQYKFLNRDGQVKSLLDIFEKTAQQIPPAGAGECAAPKLLQYAFLNALKPIAMAEFWWGQSPKSEVRRHQHFYPACNSKCKPILGHMLEGIDMDDNPMQQNPGPDKNLEYIFENELIAVINKPTEFLSVPGKDVQDSVYLRIKEKYPEADGPLIVHRLDMSTSGLMVIAKTKAAHKYLQHQFIKRYVKKRYEAVLEGILENDSGTVDLPLRVDLDDRPRQLVCYEYGKASRTHWQVTERSNGRTRVYFYPITGRTHQLRVHSAHPSGLNIPIVGDDLYGIKANRLHLHAGLLEFTDPLTRTLLKFELSAEF